MTREEAETLVKKHGGKQAAATAAGVSRHTIRWALRDGPHRGPGRPTINPVLSSSSPRSLAEFRDTYDLETIVPKRVEAALKTLGNGWLYEVEFAKTANVTSSQLSMFRDRYASHIVAVKDSRRIWVGKESNANQMRQML